MDFQKDFHQLEQELTESLVALEKEQEKLLQEKARTEAMFESIEDGVLILGPQGEVTFMNSCAEQLLDLKRSALGQKPFWTFAHWENSLGKPIPEDHFPARQAFLTWKKVATRGLYYAREDKTRFPADVIATPVILNGERIGCTVLIRDISREKIVDRAKTEFVSLSAHQLRTPLSALKWYSEALLEGHAGNLDTKQNKYLTQLHASSERMITLIDNLLDVSRIELGSFVVDPKPVDVVTIIKTLLLDFEPVIHEQHFVIAEEYKDIPKLLLVDQHLLEMTLQNILSNAVHYTLPKEAIRILATLDVKQSALLMEISDTGIGIPSEQQHRIFEKLFRADNALEMNSNGTGLGMYIAKSLVDLLGGTIHFASTLGKGTTFSLTVPVSLSPRRSPIIL